MQIIFSLCQTLTLDNYFSLSLQQLSWDLLGTKNVSSYASAKFLKVNKSWKLKRCGRHHIVVSLMKQYTPAYWVDSVLSLKKYVPLLLSRTQIYKNMCPHDKFS